MNKNELLEQIAYTRGRLDFLSKLKPNCENCDQFSNGNCDRYGKVPAEYIPVGCDLWVFFDAPF